MSEGKAKSVEVVTAFCKRAAIAQQCVNCLTEIFFEEALARAKECDDYLEKHGKTMGVLHGLPISLKVRMHYPFVNPSDRLKTALGMKGSFLTIRHTGFVQRKRFTNNNRLCLLPFSATCILELQPCEPVVHPRCSVLLQDQPPANHDDSRLAQQPVWPDSQSPQPLHDGRRIHWR